MKKLLTLFFLAFIGILLVGCGDEKINIGKTEPFDYGGYSIIRADNAAEYEVKAAISLRSRLEEAGISLALTTDWVKRGEPVPESGKEILIGVTNRSESLTSFEGLKAKDYIIRKDGERVVIAGGSEAALNAAIETFAGQCVDVKSASIKLPAGDGFKYSFKYQISALKFEGVDIGEYTLVAGNSEASVKCANIIRSRIENLTGLILPVITDQTEPREHEIIVGTNSRADSQMLEVPAGGSVIAKSSNGIVLRGSDADDDYYAVAFFILNYLGSDLKGEVNFTMKSETTFVNADMPVMDAIELYVAPGGSDENDGSLKKPFATIERARDEVRRLKEDSLAAINVNLRGGEYKLGKTVEFTSGDSGLPFSPIVYRAYKDEQAVILGGVRIPAAEAVKVADAAITGRVIDSFAASKLMMIDLKDYVDTIPGLLSGTDTLTSGAVEIYINDTALSQSRYPNDEEGTAYLRTLSVDADKENFKTLPYSFTFTDSLNRAKLWSDEAKRDLYIYGFMGNDWYDGIFKVAELDAGASRVTTVNGATYLPAAGHRFYFLNLIEEIDMPGESYIDRENKVIYFYPPCDMDDAEIYISTLNETMFKFSDVSHLTLKGIEFAYTRSNAVSAANVSHLTLDACKVAHTSSNAVSINGTNCTVMNSHIYDTAMGGITINGGNMAGLVSGENVIENNRIHSVYRGFKTYKPAIAVGSTGIVIRNNKIYDGSHELLTITTNGVIEYNEIYNAVLESSDMGAIYYGRNPATMGIEIKYNYFHDIGNTYGGIGQQSIFYDDGTSGPYVYGNIFYKGSLTEERGGKTSNSFAIKANGGQYAYIKNNIFVDMPSATHFQSWAGDYSSFDKYVVMSSNQQTRWWLWVMDAYAAQSHDIWKKISSDVDMFSDLWVNYYKGTQWEPFFGLFSREIYEQVHLCIKENDSETLAALVKQYSPAYTNLFEGNVAVKTTQGGADGEPYTGNGKGTGNYRDDDGKLASGESMFVEYGSDFKLTAAGLAEVRKTIPDFENIPTEKIGLQPYTEDDKTINVGGLEPSASDAKVEGTASVGSVVNAVYTYSDPDGDREGISKIVWYIADKQDGVYNPISGKRGGELYIDDAYKGKFIRYEVTPHDINRLYGETVVSAAVQVMK